MGISFSEAEYREGYRLGKPCLVYLRDENVPILPKFVERDPEKIALLDKFRNVLQTRHTIATFKDFHDLSVSVAADLSRTAQALEKDAARMEREPISRSAVLSEINEITDSALGKGLPESIVVSTFRHAIASLLKEQGKRNPLVFCSYSHSNKEIVKAIASGLRDAGIDVWIDEKDVTMGIGKADTISKGLDIADFLLFFISRHSTTSEWAIKELDIVISRRLSKPRNALILPVLLEDVEVPALLRDVKYLDLRDGNVSRTISDLVKIINRYSEARSEKIAKRFIGYAEKRDEIIFNLEQRIGESLHLADQIRSSEFAETIRKWIEDDYARINDITEMTKTLEKTFEEIISLNSRF
jgi:hypothetical protein